MDFEEFVTLLGPKLTAAGLPDKFNGTDFDSVFWKVLIIRPLLVTHFWSVYRRLVRSDFFYRSGVAQSVG